MIIFLFWVLASLAVAFVGTDRKIGFWGTFFLSLLLSPLVGLIVALVSAEEVTPPQKESNYVSAFTAKEEPAPSTNSQINDIERLVKLRDAGTITNDEFNVLKQNIFTPPTPPNQN